jgi:hypothetical protein
VLAVHSIRLDFVLQHRYPIGEEVF